MTKKANEITNPYTGLRPFEEVYAPFFFGRDVQVQELCDKLRKRKFIAVLGYSGSGKSSLVKCGLIPKLINDPNKAWRKVECRPGSSPMVNLANALTANEVGLFENSEGMTEFVHSLLQRSSKGLEEAAAYANLGSDEHLLILIDQFEELFRFRKYETQQQSAGAESLRFVNLLINAIESLDDRIHLVITMRSEFLGDCANFQGFPDAINQGQYLIPPMSRSELKEVITKPVIMLNKLNATKISVSRALIERVLNDLGSDQDQLPILQHTLRSTWDNWLESKDEGLIGLTHYESAGGMKNALNQHADHAYSLLKPAWKQKLCQKLFKAITEKDADGIETRRPERIDNLAKVTQMDPDSILEVVNVFTTNGSFLETYQYHGAKEEKDLIVDISHESLMRKWDQLRMWVKDESETAGVYHKLAISAKEEKDGDGDLLTGNRLIQASNWWQATNPNKEWAERYDDLHQDFIKFPGVDSYLKISKKMEKRRSEDAQQKKQRRARNRRLAFVAVSIAAIFFCSLSGYALYQKFTLEKTEVELSKKNLDLKNEKATVIEQAGQLQETIGSLNETTAALQEEKLKLETSESNLKEAYSSLLSTSKQLQSTDSALRDTISELHQKRTALAQSYNDLDILNGSLRTSRDRTDSLRKTETSRRASLAALHFLELGDGEEALELAILGDTSSTSTLSTENYQALEAVWNDQAANHRTAIYRSGVRAFSVRDSLIVSADVNGAIQIESFRSSIIKPFMDTFIQRLTFRDISDQIIEVGISPDLSRLYFGTSKGYIYQSKKQGEEYARLSKVTFEPERLQKIDTDNDAFYMANGGGLYRGSLDEPTRIELVDSLNGAELQLIEVLEKWVIVAAAQKIFLFHKATGLAKIYEIERSEGLSAVHFVPNRLLVLGFKQGTVAGYNLNEENELVGDIVTIDEHAAAISGLDVVELSGGSMQLAVASYDRKASLFQIDSALVPDVPKLSLNGHRGWVYAISYLKNAEFAVTCSEDNTIHFWPIRIAQSRDALMQIRPDKDWKND